MFHILYTSSGLTPLRISGMTMLKYFQDLSCSADNYTDFPEALELAVQLSLSVDSSSESV